MKQKSLGLVLGKFMPPHAGHLFLIEFAKQMVEELVIIVGSLRSEPIAGEVRAQWMRVLFPDCTVLHLTDENPQLPEENPDFWNIWRRSITNLMPRLPDYVIAGEAYGQPLAEVLGSQFIPAPGFRSAISISATQVRRDPIAHWDLLPEPVRRYYTKRICIVGPESTGKSTLTENLAAHFETCFVPEFARSWIEQFGPTLDHDDFIRIAHGQLAAESAMTPRAKQLIFSDTDPMCTTVWAEKILGYIPLELERLASSTCHDLYLLCDVDVPWMPDPVRYFPHERKQFFNAFVRQFEARNRRYHIIRGTWDERFQQALQIIQNEIFTAQPEDTSLDYSPDIVAR